MSPLILQCLFFLGKGLREKLFWNMNMLLSTDYSYLYVLLTPLKKSTKFTKPGSKTFVNTLLLYLFRCLLILLLQLNVFTKFGVTTGTLYYYQVYQSFFCKKGKLLGICNKSKILVLVQNWFRLLIKMIFNYSNKEYVSTTELQNEQL